MGELARIRWIPALPYVFFGHVCRLCIAWAAAHPVARVVERTLGGWPKGDRMLFEPGALMVGEVIRLHGVALGGMGEQVALLGILAFPVGILVSTWTYASMVVSPPRSFRRVGVLAIDRLPCLAALAVAQLLVAIVVVFLFYLLGQGVQAMLLAYFDPRTSDVLSWGLFALGLVLAGGSVAVFDVARGIAMRDGKSAAEALVGAMGVVRRSPWEVATSFGVRVSASIFLLVLAVFLSCWMGIDGDFSAVGGIVVQQLALFGAACLQASWFGVTMFERVGGCQSG